MGIDERWARFRELDRNIEQSLGKLIPLFQREQDPANRL